MKRGGYIIIILLGILLFSFLISKAFTVKDKISQEQILIIPVYGIISTSSSGFPFEQTGSSVTSILNELKKAKDDNKIKAVILDINSPGGTVVASKEIADAVKKLNKPSIAVIREVGASGAYWIASSSDLIIADELSITGSIGVIGSYLQFSKLMQEYGVTYERLVGGEYKDLGANFKELEQDERNILQNKIDIIHEFFIKEVKENRRLNDTKKISTGEFFLGIEAKDLGLIDKFGNKETAVEEAKKLADLKSPSVVEFKERKTLFDLIQGISSSNFYYLGKGIGNEIYSKSQNQDLEIKAL